MVHFADAVDSYLFENFSIPFIFIAIPHSNGAKLTCAKVLFLRHRISEDSVKPLSQHYMSPSSEILYIIYCILLYFDE